MEDVVLKVAMVAIDVEFIVPDDDLLIDVVELAILTVLDVEVVEADTLVLAKVELATATEVVRTIELETLGVAGCEKEYMSSACCGCRQDVE